MSIWDVVAGPLIAIINKVIPDKTAAAAAIAQLQLQTAQGSLEVEMAQLVAVTAAQSDINKAEASNISIFVAGWRPAVGWVCASGFAGIFVVFPLLTWVTTLIGRPTSFPVLDSGTLMTLLMGMLGMGAMRTIDKIKGVDTK